VQERLDRADRIERESRERDSNTQTQALNQKEDRIIDQTTKAIEPTIKTFLDKTALNDTLKTRITKMVWNELTDQVLKNDLYRRDATNCLPLLPIMSSGEWPSTKATCKSVW